LPRAAASATADPLIHEKPRLTPTLTYPRLPRTRPIRASAKSKSRSAIPPLLAMAPRRMNSGTASSGKLAVACVSRRRLAPSD
jgi:hypothetical protein